MARVYFRYREELEATVAAHRAASRARKKDASLPRPPPLPRQEAPDYGTWYLDFRDGLGRRRQNRCTARTKSEAERLLRDVSTRAERQRRGLDTDGPPPCTYAQAALAYRDSIRHLISYPDVDAQLRLYIEPEIGRFLMADITPAMVDACISKYREVLAASTLNALKIRIGAVYTWATRKGKMYRGPNPVHEATRVEVPRHMPRVLTVEQLERLLAAQGSDRFIHFFAAMTGMRKGEVAGLTWDRVDLDALVCVAHWSYGRPRTKGNADRTVPLHPALAQSLRDLRRHAKSRWVFPGPTGGMRTENWDAAENFRTALRQAGLVSGFLHQCRRSTCRNRWELPNATPVPCPRCGFRSWPRGIELEFSFKDLRSTFATHLGDPRIAQLLLGHAELKTTVNHYYRTDLPQLRAAVDGLPLMRDKDGAAKAPPAQADMTSKQGGT